MDERPTCPGCGSDETMEIRYGFFGRPEEGEEVALGGCVIFEDAPRWICPSCRHTWGRLELGKADR